MEALERQKQGDHRGIREIFLEILSTAIDDAKDMLIERFNYICSQSAESAKFMYENNIMAGYIPEKGIKSALIHGTLAVGFDQRCWPTLNTLNCGNTLRA